MVDKNSHVLVAGTGKLTEGILLCLLQAGHHVWWLQAMPESGLAQAFPESIMKFDTFHPVQKPEGISGLKLAVAVTREDLRQKADMVASLEQSLDPECLIAINSESIPLSQIQQGASHPGRVLGLNWAEPAQTTFFLEVISNSANSKQEITDLVTLAREGWGKDPYVLNNDEGIRARLLAALVREAFSLIENGYVGVEDIDRACRNDAGYYLPFAGNCRYMDLMGTWAYGTVMADLNPELSNATHTPDFFEQIITEGGKGMTNGKGFYNYSEEDKKNIQESFQKFSQEIRDLMSKYP